MSSNTAAPAEVRTCDGEEVEMMQTKTRGHFCVLAVVCFVALVVVTVPAVVIAVKNKEGDDAMPFYFLSPWVVYPPANTYHLTGHCETNITVTSRYSLVIALYDLHNKGVKYNKDTAINCTLQDIFPDWRDYQWIGEWDCTGTYTGVVNATLRDEEGWEPETNQTCFYWGKLTPSPYNV